MKILGITGSIGSGKSYFCKKLSKIRGIKVISSDEMVHQLYEDERFAKVLAERFGKEIISNSQINRKKLGEIVFKDPQKKKELENLVYPELARRRKEIIKLLNRQRFNSVLVLEIPLLFENNLEKECDYTLTVFCNPTIQKQRVLKRSSMTAEKYDSILKAQMSVAEKIKHSDFSYNSGNVSESASKAISRLLGLFKSVYLQIDKTSSPHLSFPRRRKP